MPEGRGIGRLGEKGKGTKYRICILSLKKSKCRWDCRLVQPLWKTVWNFLRKLKMELPFDPAIPLLGLHPKNPETPIQKNLCTPVFIAAQFAIAKYWKQPKCPSANEWIKKRWYIYTMEFYAAERKKELIPFATAWMELESSMLSEISQVVREKIP